jgi:DNA-binding transcriptional LysR family regulator
LTDVSTRTIRFGVHGSSHLAEQIITAAGHGLERVEFRHYDVVEPFRLLRGGDLDVMIVKYTLREPDVVYSRPVAFDGRAVIVSADHPLAARDAVSVEEVTAYDAFQCPEGFPPYVWDEVVPPATPAGTPIRRVHPMTTIEAMVAILAGTDAVHVSFRSLDPVVPPHIRVVPVHDLPAAPVALAWLRGTELSAEAVALIRDAERCGER